MRFEDGVLLHWLLPFDPLRNKRRGQRLPVFAAVVRDTAANSPAPGSALVPAHNVVEISGCALYPFARDGLRRIRRDEGRARRLFESNPPIAAAMPA
jgi:hypothetical protein